MIKRGCAGEYNGREPAIRRIQRRFPDHVKHVPPMIVDGKFIPDLRQAGLAQQVPGVLAALIVRARVERKLAK